MQTQQTTTHEKARIRIQTWNEHVKERIEMRLGQVSPIRLEHLTRLANLKARMCLNVIDRDERLQQQQQQQQANVLTNRIQL